MKIFITGATGFVGKSLVQRLLRDGHQLAAWVRDPVRARATLGPEVELVPTDGGRAALVATLGGCQAVVNLAGDPLFAGRWTAAKKAAMWTSRVDLTERLVAAMAEAATRPKVLVSSSAIGIYGDRGTEDLTEASDGAPGYLADLCRAWEAAAGRAAAFGTRVATLRIGIVLGAEGGALAQMLPIFRTGLGGPLGSGRQLMSWIHLDDLLELIVRCLGDACFQGVMNATAPHPVSNAEFSRALGRALGRPAFLPAPGPAVRLLLGEAAGVLLGGQKVLPRQAEALGFTFRYPTLEAALLRVTGLEQSLEIRRAGVLPDVPYLRARGARYHLRQETLVDLPRERVFPFFARAENLGLVTPAWLDWKILAAPPVLAKGSVIDYRIGLGPIPLSWRTVIEDWQPGHAFADAQHRGPYRSWWHQHTFEARGGRTLVIDEVWYSPPLGPLGWIANHLFVAPTLRRIFGYRTEALERLFPSPA